MPRWLSTFLRVVFLVLLAAGVAYKVLRGHGCSGQRVPADCYVRNFAR